MLIVNHNRTISRTTLIDEIWPEDPPLTAMETLNTYVYQIRKLLARGPSRRSDLVSTKPGGYELLIDPASLDLSLFENAMAVGRREFAAGRLAEASGELGRLSRRRRRAGGLALRPAQLGRQPQHTPLSLATPPPVRAVGAEGAVVVGTRRQARVAGHRLRPGVGRADRDP